MSVPFFAKANGDWFRSTPACDGEHIFVAGMRTSSSVCGSILVRNFGGRISPRSPEDRWNHSDLSARPSLTAMGVIVQTGAGIVRLEKRTG
ncbi:MAG: hypothetical protein R3B91_23380 [Planctomycetaceae bacterium]